MKKCSNCFELKSLDSFYRKLERHQSRCKACNAEVVRGYNDRAKHGEVKRYKTQAKLARNTSQEFKNLP